jgi:hypothetical protein
MGASFSVFVARRRRRTLARAAAARFNAARRVVSHFEIWPAMNFLALARLACLMLGAKHGG